MPDRLYLDHAAITPALPESRDAVVRALEVSGNPSSPHADGRNARSMLEDARRAIADALDWRHDVILTSGASEAIEIASGRVKLERRIVGPTEHEAVIGSMGGDAVVLPVDANGIIDIAALERAVASEPALVAIQLANNETGVLQPIDRIYEVVRRAGSLLLCDCAQAAGKIALPDADFLAITGQKFGGIPGSGALLVKDLSSIQPSGGQERGYRRGTENLAGIVAMAAALSSRAFVEAMPRLQALRQYLEEEITSSGGIVIAAGAPRIATIGAYAMPNVASASQVIQLDLAGISVSAGSACSSGSMKPSRVLMAMDLPQEIAETVIRVSFGVSTSRADIERFLTQWRRIRNHAKVRAA